MNTRVVCLVLPALATACVLPAPPLDNSRQFTQYLTVEFDAAQAEQLSARKGSNVIKGNGFLRQRGGGVVTCAGFEVFLIPATQYAAERFRAIYGAVDQGFNAADRVVNFIPDLPGYHQHRRAARCDAQGNFVFDQVADGEYFVHVTVRWQVAGKEQGGALMQRATVSGGQVVTFVMGR